MSLVFGTIGGSTGSACNCVGKQPGMPACPCMMRNFIQRDGRWVRQEQDFGPVQQNEPDRFPLKVATRGCVCPPGAEATCRGPLCPRQPHTPA